MRISRRGILQLQSGFVAWDIPGKGRQQVGGPPFYFYFILFYFILFYLGGKGGECIMHHNALWRRVRDSRRLAVGLNRPLDHLPSVLPPKPPPRRCSPATSRSEVGGRTLRPPFMGRVASQLFILLVFQETCCVPAFILLVFSGSLLCVVIGPGHPGRFARSCRLIGALSSA